MAKFGNVAVAISLRLVGYAILNQSTLPRPPQGGLDFFRFTPGTALIASTAFHPKRQRKFLRHGGSIFLRFRFLRRPLTRAAPVVGNRNRGPTAAAFNNKKEDTMFNSIKRKFAVRTHDHHHRPVSLRWFGHEPEIVLVDTDSGTLYANIWDDDHGKCQPSVYVNPLRAYELCRKNIGFLASVRGFPRCLVELSYVRTMDDGMALVEEVLDLTPYAE